MTNGEGNGNDKEMMSNSVEQAAGLDPKIQASIGQRLRDVYSDVINEPVPDRFTQLLNKLEQAEAGTQAVSGSVSKHED